MSTATTHAANPIDRSATSASADAVGWLIIRLAAGLFLMPHGAQKLFGLFGGGGLDGTAQFFEANLGLTPGLLFAALAGTTEFFGGLFLALGFLTRLSALAVCVLMAYAAFAVHLGSGFFWTAGGLEYPLLWGLIALGFVIRGGGAYSVDQAIGWKW
jgi:putative oxidoreductase